MSAIKGKRGMYAFLVDSEDYVVTCEAMDDGIKVPLFFYARDIFQGIMSSCQQHIQMH